jgi:hypothetical protein
MPVEFNTVGEFGAVSALLGGKARVNTQNISPSVIDINDRFISVMNDKEGDIFCVFTRDLPVNSVVTAANSPAVLNSTGAAF